jgi:uncharacterized protein
MSDEPSTEALEALLRLQRDETSIRRLEHRLAELPEQAALDANLEQAGELTAARDAKRVDLDLVAADMRKLEGELELLQQRRVDEQEKMYAGEISNPRELQALRAEIGNLGERIATLEDRLLGVMEQREELQGEIDALESRVTELADEQEQLTAARDEAAKGILAELAELEVARDGERGRVPDDVLERYEAKKEKHGAVAVGSLADGICTACRLELTPLEISELRDGPPLSTCPQCQRLLVASG